jgi:hypothetical protein
MRGRAEQGRHARGASATRSARRSHGAERTTVRSRRRAAEPVAIIGGSAVPALAGRVRRDCASADVESPTTELPVVPPAAEHGPGHERASRRGVATLPWNRPVGGARQLLRRRRRLAAFRAAGVAAVLALGVALCWPSAGQAPAPAAGATAPPAAPDAGTPDPELAGAEPTGAEPTGAEPTGAEPTGAEPTGPEPMGSGGRAFLRALRATDIAVSESGRPETEAATAICEQHARGVDQAELARAVPAMLAGLDAEQASQVVELALRYSC